MVRAVSKTTSRLRKPARPTRTPRPKPPLTNLQKILIGLTAVAAILTSLAVAWLIKNDIPQKTIDSARARWHATQISAGLVIKEIEVTGNQQLSSEYILKTTGLTKSDAPRTFFSVSLRDIRDALKNEGWIERVEITRAFPDKLYLNITERVPAAIWDNKGALTLVDRDGDVIIPIKKTKGWDVPIVTGEDAVYPARSFFEILLSFPDIERRIGKLERISKRRWDATLTNGILLKLPEENVEKALQVLAELQEEEKLLDRPLKVIDMRVSDRLFVER